MARRSGIADGCTRVLAGATPRVVANGERVEIAREFGESELTATRVASLVRGDPHGDHAVAKTSGDFVQVLAGDRGDLPELGLKRGQKLDLRLGVRTHRSSPFLKVESGVQRIRCVARLLHGLIHHGLDVGHECINGGRGSRGRNLDLDGGGSSRLLLLRLHRRVDLLVEREERITDIGGEASHAVTDGLHAILEDAEGVNDVFQPSRRDHLGGRTVAVRLADDVCPLAEGICELLVGGITLTHDGLHDLLLDGDGRVVLLNRDAEPLKERLVQNRRACEAFAVVAALPLRVGRGEDVEPRSRKHLAVHLLQIDAATLKHGLKAHDLVRGEVNLVEDQHRTTLHGDDHGAVLPHGFAVDESEAAKQIVLVGLRRDVDADALAVHLVADLFDHGGLAVARQTRDVGREEPALLHDLLHDVVVAEGDVRPDLRGNEVGVTDLMIDALHIAGEVEGGVGHLQRILRGRGGGGGVADVERTTTNLAGSEGSVVEVDGQTRRHLHEIVASAGVRQVGCTGSVADQGHGFSSLGSHCVLLVGLGCSQ